MEFLLPLACVLFLKKQIALQPFWFVKYLFNQMAWCCVRLGFGILGILLANNLQKKTVHHHLGGSKKYGKPPQIIRFNRVFHYCHHPFWATPIFGNTHLYRFFHQQQQKRSRIMPPRSRGSPARCTEDHLRPPDLHCVAPRETLLVFMVWYPFATEPGALEEVHHKFVYPPYYC